MKSKSKFHIILSILIILEILIALCFMLIIQRHTGYEFDDGLLQLISQSDILHYEGPVRGRNVAVQVKHVKEGETKVIVLINGMDPEEYNVYYPLDTLNTVDGLMPGVRIEKYGDTIFEGAWNTEGYKSASGYKIYSPDGTQKYSKTIDMPSVRGGNYWSNYYTRIDNVFKYADGPDLTSQGDWLIFIFSTIIALVALLLALIPEKLFILRYHKYGVTMNAPAIFLNFMKGLSVFFSIAVAIFYCFAIISIA